MPELPEVQTVVSTLNQLIQGERIVDVIERYDGIIRSHHFDVVGHQIHQLSRRGKYILFHLDDLVMISHLRMEGKYFIKTDQDEFDKHDHVIFVLESGKQLRYNDTRKFGTMELLHPDEVEVYFQSRLGIEPDNPALTVKYLKSFTHKQTLKGFLLDQRIVAGLGNIYVNEVCFLSNLHPASRMHRLRKKDYEALVQYIPYVIQKAIDLGGTTIRSYTDSLGVTGRFQNELTVHDREGEECLVCSTVIRKTFVNGRGTYYCPTCQIRR
jgi:formamidopyrimidine-DNA glycosylase